MKPLCSSFAVVLFFCSALFAADPVAPAKPVLKITPGEVIVPTDRMRRMWGELISLDMKTRTGKFRSESDDEVRTFTIMPYAELLHHASFGDLQDYQVVERAIFRLHENEAGEWVYLTYIQDEMNFYRNHKEFLHVVSIDPKTGRLMCNQGKADKSYIREEGIAVDTDDQTRFWKGGVQVKFADIQLGDKLQTKSRGTGKGKGRICWEVFIDEQSLEKFRTEQQAIHAKRMQEEGYPGYVDQTGDGQLMLTLFHEAVDFSKAIKAGDKVRVAPAGVDRKPTSEPVMATVKQAKMERNNCKLALTVEPTEVKFTPTELARVWVLTK